MTMPPATTDYPFVIRRSKIQGKGAYATRPIRKGERIIEYVGERISWAESDRRYDDTKTKRHHTFLFAVNKKIVIDAAVGGNDARFINHSCEPNCEAVGEKSRIFIEALRAIQPGEELTYDYAYEREKGTTEEDEKLYVCHCGSARCRGTILAPQKQRRPRKTHHVAARQPHTTDRVKTKRRKANAAGMRRGRATDKKSMAR
jgi:SET domain-containing protein